MYRKQLRQMQEMDDQNQALTRVSSYPVVKDTWNKVSEVYQRGKQGSRILRFCGTMAESSASLAFRASQPVIDKLPVGIVNDYAVTKLESLEEKYPVIAKPTEEMVDAVKTYSSSKYDEAKTYSADQFNRLAEISRLDMLIDVADTVVDSLLPAVPTEEGDDEEKVEKPTEALMKVRMLSDKVKRRAYHTAITKVGAIKKRSQESMDQLVHTVNLIDFAEKYLIGDVRGRVEDVRESACVTYRRVKEVNDNAIENVERLAVSTAHALVQRARSNYAAVSRVMINLPSRTRNLLIDTYNSAVRLILSINSNARRWDRAALLNFEGCLNKYMKSTTPRDMVILLQQFLPSTWKENAVREPAAIVESPADSADDDDEPKPEEDVTIGDSTLDTTQDSLDRSADDAE